MPPYRPPPSGNLPRGGKVILREVYIDTRTNLFPHETAFDKAQSAQIAWGAVKKAGYHKNKKGQWVGP